MSIIQKNYEKLCKERDAVLDEKKFYSQFTTNERIGLFICERYDYIDELSYIIKRIEKEIIPYEILYKLKLYKKLTQKIILDYGEHQVCK